MFGASLIEKAKNLARRVGVVLFEATRNFDRDGCFDQGAYISYFALLSLLPLTILLVALGAEVIGSVDAAERGVEFLLKDLVSPLGEDVFAQAREVGSQAARFGWPFFLFSLWTASKVFSKVEQALDQVFQVEKRRSFPARKIFAFGLVVLLVVVLVALVFFRGSGERAQSFPGFYGLGWGPLQPALSDRKQRYHPVSDSVAADGVHLQLRVQGGACHIGAGAVCYRCRVCDRDTLGGAEERLHALRWPIC